MQNIDVYELDPNFATVFSYVKTFGKQIGEDFENEITIGSFKTFLESKEVEPDNIYVRLHIKFLRAIGEKVLNHQWYKAVIKNRLIVTSRRSDSNKWSNIGSGEELMQQCRLKFDFTHLRATDKFAEDFPDGDDKLVREKGYEAIPVEVKLRLLKNLCEDQFEFNDRFNRDVNDALQETGQPGAVRQTPVGRDKLGRSYWFLLDQTGCLRLYRGWRDDLTGEETWNLLCKDSEELEDLIEVLSSEDLDGDEDPLWPPQHWPPQQTKTETKAQSTTSVNSEGDACVKGESKIGPKSEKDVKGKPKIRPKSEKDVKGKPKIGPKSEKDVKGKPKIGPKSEKDTEAKAESSIRKKTKTEKDSDVKEEAGSDCRSAVEVKVKSEKQVDIKVEVGEGTKAGNKSVVKQEPWFMTDVDLQAMADNVADMVYASGRYYRLPAPRSWKKIKRHERKHNLPHCCVKCEPLSRTHPDVKVETDDEASADEQKDAMAEIESDDRASDHVSEESSEIKDKAVKCDEIEVMKSDNKGKNLKPDKVVDISHQNDSGYQDEGSRGGQTDEKESDSRNDADSFEEDNDGWEEMDVESPDSSAGPLEGYLNEKLNPRDNVIKTGKMETDAEEDNGTIQNCDSDDEEMSPANVREVSQPKHTVLDENGRGTPGINGNRASDVDSTDIDTTDIGSPDEDIRPAIGESEDDGKTNTSTQEKCLRSSVEKKVQPTSKTKSELDKMMQTSVDKVQLKNCVVELKDLASDCSQQHTETSKNKGDNDVKVKDCVVKLQKLTQSSRYDEIQDETDHGEKNKNLIKLKEYSFNFGKVSESSDGELPTKPTTENKKVDPVTQGMNLKPCSIKLQKICPLKTEDLQEKPSSPNCKVTVPVGKKTLIKQCSVELDKLESTTEGTNPNKHTSSDKQKKKISKSAQNSLDILSSKSLGHNESDISSDSLCSSDSEGKMSEVSDPGMSKPSLKLTESVDKSCPDKTVMKPCAVKLSKLDSTDLGEILKKTEECPIKTIDSPALSSTSSIEHGEAKEDHEDGKELCGKETKTKETTIAAIHVNKGHTFKPEDASHADGVIKHVIEKLTGDSSQQNVSKGCLYSKEEKIIKISSKVLPEKLKKISVITVCPDENATVSLPTKKASVSVPTVRGVQEDTIAKLRKKCTQQELDTVSTSDKASDGNTNNQTEDLDMETDLIASAHSSIDSINYGSAKSKLPEELPGDDAEEDDTVRSDQTSASSLDSGKASADTDQQNIDNALKDLISLEEIIKHGKDVDDPGRRLSANEATEKTEIHKEENLTLLSDNKNSVDDRTEIDSSKMTKETDVKESISAAEAGNVQDSGEESVSEVNDGEESHSDICDEADVDVIESENETGENRDEVIDLDNKADNETEKDKVVVVDDDSLDGTGVNPGKPAAEVLLDRKKLQETAEKLGSKLKEARETLFKLINSQDKKNDHNNTNLRRSPRKKTKPKYLTDNGESDTVSMMVDGELVKIQQVSDSESDVDIVAVSDDEIESENTQGGGDKMDVHTQEERDQVLKLYTSTDNSKQTCSTAKPSSRSLRNFNIESILSSEPISSRQATINSAATTSTTFVYKPVLSPSNSSNASALNPLTPAVVTVAKSDTRMESLKSTSKSLNWTIMHTPLPNNVVMVNNVPSTTMGFVKPTVKLATALTSTPTTLVASHPSQIYMSPIATNTFPPSQSGMVGPVQNRALPYPFHSLTAALTNPPMPSYAAPHTFTLRPAMAPVPLMNQPSSLGHSSSVGTQSLTSNPALKVPVKHCTIVTGDDGRCYEKETGKLFNFPPNTRMVVLGSDGQYHDQKTGEIVQVNLNFGAFQKKPQVLCLQQKSAISSVKKVVPEKLKQCLASKAKGQDKLKGSNKAKNVPNKLKERVKKLKDKKAKPSEDFEERRQRRIQKEKKRAEAMKAIAAGIKPSKHKGEHGNSGKKKKRRGRKPLSEAEQSSSESEKDDLDVVVHSGEESDKAEKSEDSDYDYDRISRRVKMALFGRIPKVGRRKEVFTAEDGSDFETDFHAEQRNPIVFGRNAVLVAQSRNIFCFAQEDFEDDLKSPCQVCEKIGNPDSLLLCDTCDDCYHMTCLAPPLILFPLETWFCPECEHNHLLCKLKDKQLLAKKQKKSRARKMLRHTNPYVRRTDDMFQVSQTNILERKRSDRTQKEVNYSMDRYDKLVSQAVHDAEIVSSDNESEKDNETNHKLPAKSKKRKSTDSYVKKRKRHHRKVKKGSKKKRQKLTALEAQSSNSESDYDLSGSAAASSDSEANDDKREVRKELNDAGDAGNTGEEVYFTSSGRKTNSVSRVSKYL